MNLLKGIHHIAIICSDYSVSKKFYTDILGLKIKREVYRQERDSYKLDLSLDGNYLIELFSFPSVTQRASKPEATGLRHLAFKVKEVEKTLQYFQEKGVAYEEVRTDEFTGKKFCFIFDPDHLPIELYEE